MLNLLVYIYVASNHFYVHKGHPDIDSGFHWKWNILIGYLMQAPILSTLRKQTEIGDIKDGLVGKVSIECRSCTWLSLWMFSLAFHGSSVIRAWDTEALIILIKFSAKIIFHWPLSNMWTKKTPDINFLIIFIKSCVCSRKFVSFETQM